MSLLRGLLLVAVVLALASCATPQFEPQQSEVLKERAGRFSVLTQAPNEAAQAVQGNFVWRRLVSGWQLDLKSPLGTTLARLTVDQAGATLEQPDAPLRRASSGNELLATVIGATVPMDVLEDWVDGRVIEDNQVTDVKRDQQGRISSFSQAGWQVKFENYGAYGPDRVTAQGKQFGQSVTLRLVAEQPQ